MLSWPPGRPGPSSPGNLLTTQGCWGMGVARGGNAPDLPRSANIGVSCRVGSGSAAKAWLQIRPKKKALVKTRRFIIRLRVAYFYRFGSVLAAPAAVTGSATIGCQVWRLSPGCCRFAWSNGTTRSLPCAVAAAAHRPAGPLKSGLPAEETWTTERCRVSRRHFLDVHRLAIFTSYTVVE